MQHVETHHTYYAKVIKPFYDNAARFAQQRQIDCRRLPPFLFARLDSRRCGGNIGDDVPFDALEIYLLAAGDKAFGACWRGT